jgi:RHS repeat-associated protein
MRSWYSGDRQLMAVQRYEEAGGGSGDAFGTWEEYWYDALGRRILTRVRRDGLNKPDDSNVLCQGTSAGCGSYVERTQWDGAQIIGEWRTAETTPTGMTSGAVSYVYLDQLDQPIGLLTGDTARVVQYTWRGLAEGTVFIDGTPGDCSIVTTGCLRVRWPAATQGAVYYTPNLLDSNQSPSTNDRWFGTLLANGQGTTGQVFRRNRFFDPASGQFTQEDPIGLGGGLNLWGIAGGDPVNFSDPFGLCPVPQLCALGIVTAGAAIGAAAYQLYENAASGQALQSGVLAAAVRGARNGAALFVSSELAGGAVRALAGRVAATGGVGQGTKVYRVWGNGAVANGRSWTTVNPASVPNYRAAAGLPSQNTGRFVSEGVIRDATGITTRTSLPLGGNPGGLPEVLIPNPSSQVQLTRVSGVNPHF